MASHLCIVWLLEGVPCPMHGRRTELTPKSQKESDVDDYLQQNAVLEPERIPKADELAAHLRAAREAVVEGRIAGPLPAGVSGRPGPDPASVRALAEVEKWVRRDRSADPVEAAILGALTGGSAYLAGEGLRRLSAQVPQLERRLARQAVRLTGLGLGPSGRSGPAAPGRVSGGGLHVNLRHSAFAGALFPAFSRRLVTFATSVGGGGR